MKTIICKIIEYISHIKFMYMKWTDENVDKFVFLKLRLCDACKNFE